MNNKKEVLQKWFSDLAVVYRVDNILLFYSAEKDPNFKRGQLLTIDEAQNTEPYKALKFDMNNVPNDLAMSILF